MPNFRATVLSFAVLDNKNPENLIFASLLRVFSLNGLKLAKPVVINHIFNQETAEHYLDALGYAKGVNIGFELDGICEFELGVDRTLPGNDRNPEPLDIHRPLGKLTGLVVENPKRLMKLETVADLAVATLPKPMSLATVGAPKPTTTPVGAALSHTNPEPKSAFERAMNSIGLVKKAG
jgi:hypothetical protein